MVRRWLFCLLLFAGLDIAAFFYWRWRHEHRFDAPIRAAAARHGLPPALVKAVVWRESNFDPDAVGKEPGQRRAAWRIDVPFRHRLSRIHDRRL